jgi:transcriptional regulator with XRE-family HTH domain
MTDPTGAPRAKALAGTLRRALADADLGVREVARRMGMSHSVISDWINGKKVPSPGDVSRLLTELNVGTDQQDAVLRLVHGVGEPNWLAVGIPGVSHQLAGAMECEQTATAITEWAFGVVPGLLQTSDYARAVIGAEPLPKAEIESRILVRMGRRDIVLRSHPVTLNALISEAVLRNPIGGRAVMAAQLRSLVEIAARPTVTIRVVPIDAGWHPGLAGPFVLYHYAGAPAILMRETYRGGTFVTESDEVAAYETAAEQIRRVAMNPDATSRLIADIAQEMESR